MIMNDEERQDWVMNDEYLYNWWKREGCGITTFVRKHRKDLTEYIYHMITRYDK